LGVKTGVRLAAIVLIGAFATGCASNTPDPRDLQDQLVAIGVAPAAAKCLVKEMRKDFTDRRLGAEEQPTAEEITLQRKLLRRCNVKITKG
jgi:hypothetical protein